MTNLDLTPDSYAEAAGFDGDWRDTWHNEDFLALMAQRWGLADKRKALDVGAGHGHWGQALLPHMHPKAHLVGVDNQAPFLMAAQRRSKQRGLGPRTGYLLADAMTLPFGDQRFDLVTCQTLLCHVPNAKRALGEMIRVLKPGGRLVLSEPNNLATSAAWQMAEPRPTHQDYLRLIELQLVCEKGKRTLKEGDSSIGERLPGLLGRYGLKVEVHSSDHAPALVPPYADARSQLELETQRKWWSEGWYMPIGNRALAERLFAAGNPEGDPDNSQYDFESLWEVAQRRMQQLLEAADAGTLSGARGVGLYLVSAVRPYTEHLPPPSSVPAHPA